MADLLHQFSDWYLSTLSQGGYWLIAGLMALESTIVPIPSEVIVPPAAYLAHTQGQFSFVGVVLAAHFEDGVYHYAGFALFAVSVVWIFAGLKSYYDAKERQQHQH